MPATSPLQAVIDTNVVFEGLTKRKGACAVIVDAWQAELFLVRVSNALALEYVDVLSSRLSQERWQRIRPVLENLLDQAQFVNVYFTKGFH